MLEEKVHLLLRLWEEHPSVILLAGLLFAGIMLVLFVIAGYQTLQKGPIFPSSNNAVR